MMINFVMSCIIAKIFLNGHKVGTSSTFINSFTLSSFKEATNVVKPKIKKLISEIEHELGKSVVISISPNTSDALISGQTIVDNVKLQCLLMITVRSLGQYLDVNDMSDYTIETLKSLISSNIGHTEHFISYNTLERFFGMHNNVQNTVNDSDLGSDDLIEVSSREKKKPASFVSIFESDSESEEVNKQKDRKKSTQPKKRKRYVYQSDDSDDIDYIPSKRQRKCYKKKSDSCSDSSLSKDTILRNWIPSYTRKDGTKVRRHLRKLPEQGWSTADGYTEGDARIDKYDDSDGFIIDIDDDSYDYIAESESSCDPETDYDNK